MKQIFISQPMRGRTVEEIILERNSAIDKAIEMFGNDIKFANSYLIDSPDSAKPLWYLGRALQLLSESDVALFVDGWENNRGCVIEHTCCEKYGVPIYYFNKKETKE